MKAYTYVIQTDAGSAPNYDAPATTLAICKPRIRRAAQVGDLVLAFQGSAIGPEPHAVVWAGVVSEKISFSDYWNNERFAGKKPPSRQSDNIYRPTADGFVQVRNVVHGRDNVSTDLSGQFVLVFAQAWHFGPAAPILPAEFGLRMVSGRRQHRVHHDLESRWSALRSWLREQRRTRKLSGRPHCHRADPERLPLNKQHRSAAREKFVERVR